MVAKDDSEGQLELDLEAELPPWWEVSAENGTGQQVSSENGSSEHVEKLWQRGW